LILVLFCWRIDSMMESWIFRDFDRCFGEIQIWFWNCKLMIMLTYEKCFIVNYWCFIGNEFWGIDSMMESWIFRDFDRCFGEIQIWFWNCKLMIMLTYEKCFIVNYWCFIGNEFWGMFLVERKLGVDFLYR
jgi:hypothetical protein